MRLFSVLLLFFALSAPSSAQPASSAGSYPGLLALHEELRSYMVPAFTPSVVLDSGARVGEGYADDVMTRKLAGLSDFEARLASMNVAEWPREQQVEFLAVKSLLNGYRFNLSVLRPWKRDPGFYLDPLMRVAFTELPVQGERLAELRTRLAAVPPMLAGARANLTEVAGDFADLALFNLHNSDGVNHYHPYRAVPPPGIIGWYDDLLDRARERQPGLADEVLAARKSLAEFGEWLRRERAGMTASAGVGAARYQWYITHVRMIPYSTAEMLVLAEREHERLSAGVALLRHRNRNVPELQLSRSAAEQEQKIAETDQRVRDFLVREEIVTIPAYVGELGSNTPWIERPGGPNFWEQIQFRDPIPDHLHAVIPGHRFDAEIARRDDRPIRGQYSDGARAEGWATYLEESLAIAGATAHSPRADEYIHLFGIFRAARVPADIYMQHNELGVAEGVQYMRRMTPWLDEDVARVDAEIYLRRPPGYGLAYTIGKLQMDALLADRSRQLGNEFVLRDFHDAFLASGRLPIALTRYEMTGEGSEVAAFWHTPPIPPPVIQLSDD
jgi:hypothetical protein